ncbi:signal transduction protein [Leptospira ryugenii]|uniref:Signal transduction protein n=1 Tax=Leptospira ryugenii TaxID=1917863 RepID=A0A2P2E2H7_9LEPT|nr:EAL domain-containing protein [Leptospira ryugenii]GBF51088.1 signal transduction protein [Leptospira ryugenii]
MRPAKITFPEEFLESSDGITLPKKISCEACRSGAGLDFDFTMAFQAIVDLDTKSIFSQEALVRGKNQESAGSILSKVNDKNRYQFDQACRVKAIELASRLGIDSFLNINFLPNAVYRPETCIRTTLDASKQFSFPQSKIIFEITEGEEVTNPEHIISIFREYKNIGFLTAIDDFGAGYSGLNLLSKFLPDLIKLDMALIRNVDQNKNAQIIIKNIMNMCNELEVNVIAEGIETQEELNVLRDSGIRYYQGYLFAKPSWESLAIVTYPN